MDDSGLPPKGRDFRFRLRISKRIERATPASREWLLAWLLLYMEVNGELEALRLATTYEGKEPCVDGFTDEQAAAFWRRVVTFNAFGLPPDVIGHRFIEWLKAAGYTITPPEEAM